MKRQKQTAGEQIQRFRNLWNMSQAELADMLQTSADYISDIESGGKPLSFRMAWKFCTLFGVSLDTLYFGQDTQAFPELVKEDENFYSLSSSFPFQELLETCTEEECSICEQILETALKALRQPSPEQEFSNNREPEALENLKDPEGP